MSIPWAQARAQRGGNEHPTRTALLDAAVEVFGTSGYSRTTIATIADAAAVSRASFYLYFTSKADIFHAVAAQVRDEILAAHDIPGIDEGDPVSLGRASSTAFLDAYSRYYELLITIENQAIADPALAEIWTEIQTRPRKRLIRYIERLSASGDADLVASPEATAEAVLGMFTRFAQLASQREDYTAEALNALYLRLLGIDSTPAPEQPASTES